MKEESRGNTKAQSTLEILIALAVLMLSVSAIIAVAFGNQFASADGQNRSQALLYASELLEEARAASRSDFAGVVSTSSSDGIFTRALTVAHIGPYTKKVTGEVSWHTDLVALRSVKLVTLLTDWQAPDLVDGTSGGGGLSGNWLIPRTAGTLDLGAGNVGTDIGVKFQTVFMTGSASDAKKSDFFSIDVSNTQGPQMLATLNTGPGLASISLTGDYAYVANTDNSSQLQVINVANPLAPTLTGSASMRGVNSKGKSVYAYQNRAYIGSERSSGQEFQIFDVGNPASPAFLGSAEIGADVNDIYVLGNTAYLATSRSDAAVMIFDVSNPSSPSLLSSFSDPMGGGVGFSVFATSPGTLFAGIGGGLRILDVSNPRSPVPLGRFDAGGAVNDIYVRDYLAFLATANSNTEFQAVNIDSLQNPALHSSLNFPQVATGVAYRNNVVYVSVRSNDSLRIITSQQ